ncbi:Fanconi anemia group J protein, partial [Coemansia biformis]
MTSPKESPANAKGPPLRSDSAKGSEGAARSISATEIRLVGDVPYNSYYIGGVEVHFPFRPYPSQLGMINHMMRALNREQNAMIESPTGSGKSLALLCAVLSWQRDFMAKNRRVRANVDQIIKKFCRYNPTLAASFHGFGSMLASEDGGSGKGVPTMMDGGGIGAAEAEECKAADGCDSAGAETGSTLGPSPASGAQSPVPDTPASADTACRGEAAQCDTKATDSKREEAATSATMRVFLGMAQALWKSTASQILEHAARRIPAGLTEADIACLREGLQSGATGPPKIYFGSRTHRQVAQLVDELRRKTPYRLSMAVLGSRSQTCIHHRAPRASSVDDMCRELVDDNNCRFFSRSKLLVGNEKVRAGGELEIWDLEDIVDLGRQVQACPYFASRELAEKAQLVFCPYNYVVDPGIREAVGIDLVGSIVILDEAHNIESAAREAGSFEITDLHLARLAVDCAELMQQGIMPIQHG